MDKNPIVQALEVLAVSLGEIQKVQVDILHYMAEAAQASEEHSKHLTGLASSFKKLAEEFVEQGRRFDETVTTVQNYVNATIELRQEARNLISTVRQANNGR